MSPLWQGFKNGVMVINYTMRMLENCALSGASDVMRTQAGHRDATMRTLILIIIIIIIHRSLSIFIECLHGQ